MGHYLLFGKGEVPLRIEMFVGPSSDIRTKQVYSSENPDNNIILEKKDLEGGLSLFVGIDYFDSTRNFELTLSEFRGIVEDQYMSAELVLSTMLGYNIKILKEHDAMPAAATLEKYRKPMTEILIDAENKLKEVAKILC